MSKRLILFPAVLLVLFAIAFAVEQLTEPTQPAPEAQNDGPPQWKLPKFLRESSGLAIASDEYLLIHNDEQGHIYRLHIQDKQIDLVADIDLELDFEGIAIAGEDVWMTTSIGRLYRVENLDHLLLDQKLTASEFDSGLMDICEIEGLHYVNGQLLLPCKTPYIDEHKDKLVVFGFDIETGTTSTYLSIPRDQLDVKHLEPTAIDSDDTHYYVIIQHRLVRIDRITKNVQVYRLPKKTHIQPEGLAVLSDKSIVIVEDNRKGRAKLTHYSSLNELEPSS